MHDAIGWRILVSRSFDQSSNGPVESMRQSLSIVGWHPTSEDRGAIRSGTYLYQSAAAVFSPKA